VANMKLYYLRRIAGAAPDVPRFRLPFRLACIASGGRDGAGAVKFSCATVPWARFVIECRGSSGIVAMVPVDVPSEYA
jgi:hypothetical protein